MGSEIVHPFLKNLPPDVLFDNSNPLNNFRSHSHSFVGNTGDFFSYSENQFPIEDLQWNEQNNNTNSNNPRHTDNHIHSHQNHNQKQRREPKRIQQ
jgi:hypothetical protein